MNLLIDTHILIRLLSGDTTLPYKLIVNADFKTHALHVSIASLWEIAIKLNIGKLKIEGTFDDIQPILKKNHISILAILPSHLKQLISLPMLHRDPFDRLIISQSIVQEFTLVTDDNLIRSYPGLKIL